MSLRSLRTEVRICVNIAGSFRDKSVQAAHNGTRNFLVRFRHRSSSSPHPKIDAFAVHNVSPERHTFMLSYTVDTAAEFFHALRNVTY
jgi:hypothetical protein